MSLPTKVQLVLEVWRYLLFLLSGLFESSHMQFETDRSDENIEAWGEPSLTEMTEKAIRLLSKQSEGYFLLVEGTHRSN